MYVLFPSLCEGKGGGGSEWGGVEARWYMIVRVPDTLIKEHGVFEGASVIVRVNPFNGMPPDMGRRTQVSCPPRKLENTANYLLLRTIPNHDMFI